MCERIDLGEGHLAIVCGGRRAHGKRSMNANEAKTLKLPATLEQLKAAGWKCAYSRECKLCHTSLEFWRTAAGKLMPLEGVLVEGIWLRASHWATCVFADEFRRPAPKPVDPEKQRGLFE